MSARCAHPDHVDGESCEDRAVGCSPACRCCMGALAAEPVTIKTLASLACAEELQQTEAAAREAGMGDADVSDELDRIRARWFKSAGVVPATIPVSEEWFKR